MEISIIVENRCVRFKAQESEERYVTSIAHARLRSAERERIRGQSGGAGVGQVGPDHLDPQVILHLLPY